ncbi:DUF4397 domain-containing protein [Mucilaginibacter sp. PAMB04168]|uniref:DUF4397 domain-containing protein n=1 Tax=Mucilaginibacter sp. PAMB04168 TaxID=3138567 RepID=UPI0031F64B7B
MKRFPTALKQTLRYAFVGLLGLSLLSSCKKDDPYDFKDTITADVNLINASPDATAARLYVDDVLRTPNGVNYGDASGYNKSFLGDQDVEIRSVSGEAVLASTHGQFDAYASYTYFLVGQNSSLGLVIVTDDLAAPSAGKAKIRFVNAAPNASNATLNNGSTVLVGPQNFRGIAPSTEVAAGSYTLTVASGLVRSATTTVNLESGKIYTVYAKGLIGTAGASAFGVGVFVNK